MNVDPDHVRAWVKNLLTGPDGESFSVSKTGAAMVLLTALFVAIAEVGWLCSAKEH